MYSTSRVDKKPLAYWQKAKWQDHLDFVVEIFTEKTMPYEDYETVCLPANVVFSCLLC